MRWMIYLLALVGLVISLASNRTFIPGYQNSIYTTAHLQLEMAQWIDEHLPTEARIGVTDVGMVRYMGNRATYDLIGLTTPEVAITTRQGAGAVYDTMAYHPQRPDYFALYPIHINTIYLMDSGVWSQDLQRFDVTPLEHNTASAASWQIVASADWSAVTAAETVYQPSTLTSIQGLEQIGTLNVGDVNSETAHEYHWRNPIKIPGFLTALEKLSYYTCDQCEVLDGARGISGEERFTLPEGTTLVVLRVHAAQAARLTYGCEETVGRRVVPEIPGNWVEIVMPVTEREFCLHTEGIYHAARYWFYAGEVNATVPDTEPVAAWGKLGLLDYTLTQTDDTLTLDLQFGVRGAVEGDGKLFIHLYADPAQAPVRQWDGYLGGAVPLGNLLPGTFEQQATLSLTDLPPGEYVIGLGFYDRGTGQRYGVTGENTDGGRVMVDSVVIR